jgi:stage V sporulation protein D (sporulation-specific penicillin-binding protein)
LQFVQGKELSEKAYNQQLKNQIISPNRGTIYDSKGEILAQSISVDTISLNPGKVKYSNNKDVPDEVIAEGISNIFDVTYDEMMEKLSSNKSVIVIERKVETDKVDELKKWMSENGITTGINIDEDSKRYYPYNDLASNLIGFCGTDNTGQTGLEERWNDVLTGTAGKIVTAVDVEGNAISDEDELYIASENGSNIYLTIDSSIQAIAENYLEQGVKENTTATGGNVIMMNPQTGEILAMATYPNYNLNDPSSYISTGYTEEEWNALEKTDRTNALLTLWKNKAVSDVYEPGSTFKLITAAVGLEEGYVQTDTENDFYCSGSQVVGKDTDGKDISISCWRSYNPHGYQTLRNALCNSCNPAFMQLGQRIGAKTLYKYYQAFGLFESVGSDIAKAYAGKFHSLDEIGPVELATTSFGQRFTISPLQLVSAVSAICNDGVLVKPKIVKQIENTDTGSIEVVETETIRQVISKQTADQVKSMMESVVLEGTGGKVKIEGYSIGGKSGTSEPQQGSESSGYVASFIAITPIENTQLVTLVALYGLQESAEHQGGAVAGPIARQILTQVLPLLGITSSTTQEVDDESDEKLISVPNVKNMTLSEAKNTLQQNFTVISNSNVDENTVLVTDQVPKQGSTLTEGSIICLYTSDEETRVKTQVPNVKGMTAAQATNALRAKNLNIKIDGTSGVVSSQEPTYETEVEEGTIVNVVISEELNGAY